MTERNLLEIKLAASIIKKQAKELPAMSRVGDCNKESKEELLEISRQLDCAADGQKVICEEVLTWLRGDRSIVNDCIDD